MKKFDWQNELHQLFAATVNQQTLEEAAELMVSVSARDSEYHAQCLAVFDEAMHAKKVNEDLLIACINKSGYQVTSVKDAKDLLQEFREIYINEFRRATGVPT